MSILSAPAAPTNRKSRKPITVELILRINGIPYTVVAIDPGPDNSAAVRLVKHGNADTVYDACRTNEGELRCDCPDWEVRSPDQCGYLCKHLVGLTTVGLLEAPAVAPLPVGPDPRDAYNDHREKLAAIAEAEAVVRAEGEVYRANVTLDQPARVVAPSTASPTSRRTRWPRVVPSG